MNKRGYGRVHQDDELLSLNPKVAKGFESGFSSTDYRKIQTELSDLHERLKGILEIMVYADATEYYRLAKIVDNGLEELISKVQARARSEFPRIPEVKPPRDQNNQEDNDEVTWESLCRLEPELLELWNEAKEMEDNPRRKSFCAVEYLGEHLLDRLSELMGPWNEERNPKLKSLKSLELARLTILNALPPCRKCNKSGHRSSS